MVRVTIAVKHDWYSGFDMEYVDFSSLEEARAFVKENYENFIDTSEEKLAAEERGCFLDLDNAFYTTDDGAEMTAYDISVLPDKEYLQDLPPTEMVNLIADNKEALRLAYERYKELYLPLELPEEAYDR